MISFQSFADEFEKIAATAAQKADMHHGASVKDWKEFEKALGSQAFQKAILKHSDSDDKLKRYVKNVGGHKKSKDIVGVAPSRTSSNTYDVKQLPKGRWSCGCKDWQYVHSVKNTDCDHIKALKAIYQQQGKNKVSSIPLALIGGAVLHDRLNNSVKEYKKGVVSSRIAKAVTPRDPSRLTLRDIKETII